MTPTSRKNRPKDRMNDSHSEGPEFQRFCSKQGLTLLDRIVAPSREVSQRPIGPEGRILRGGHDVSQHVALHQPVLGVELNHHVSKPVHVNLMRLL